GTNRGGSFCDASFTITKVHSTSDGGTLGVRVCLAPRSYPPFQECLAAGLRGCGISGTNLHSGFDGSIKRLNCMAIKMDLVFLVGLPGKRRANDFGNLALLLCDRVHSMVCARSVGGA